MVNTRWVRAFAVAALAAAVSSCSLKNVASDGLQLCRSGSCRALADGSREELAGALYSFLKAAEGKELELSEEKPGSTESRGRGVRVFTQGGPISAVYKGKTIAISDVRAPDAEGVIKFSGRSRGTYLWVPVLCALGSGTVRVYSASDARLELTSPCTWVVSGPMVWKWSGIIDRLDLDSGLLGMRYAVKGGGLIVAGGGKGYLLARASDAPAPPSAAPAPAKEAGTVTMDARLYVGGDSVIDAGESFTVAVELFNAGTTVLQGVRLQLTGTPELVAVLPVDKLVGTLDLGQKATVSLSGTLPAGTASQAGTMRVLALSGPDEQALGSRSFEFPLRGAEPGR